jgi:putative ABC transport system ATP-binding protein
MAVIELRGITKVYPMGDTELVALRGVDLSFERGHFIAVMGPSGCGKSTLLNLLGLLDSPTRGSYYLQGEDVGNLNDNTMSAIRCRKVGIIFQSFNLFPHFSILENVCVPMRYANVPQDEMYERAASLLSRLGLGERLYDRPTRLSGGQRQRVAIARALANDPPVVLADEPTGNLDEQTGQEVMDIFRELVDDGRTIVMVSHNPEYESQVERVVHLLDGEVVGG